MSIPPDVRVAGFASAAQRSERHCVAMMRVVSDGAGIADPGRSSMASYRAASVEQLAPSPSYRGFAVLDEADFADALPTHWRSVR